VNLIRSRLSALAITLGVIAALSVVEARPAAGADAVSITCLLGSQTTTYDPGLTFQTRPTSFSVKGTLDGCVSPTNPQVVRGTFSGKGSGSFSCLAASAPLTTVIEWNTGQQTTVLIDLTVNAKPNGTTVLVSAGRVISGLFRGGLYTSPKVLPNTDLVGCATPQGVPAASGAVVVTIGLTP
jgi:hypothetical protein